MFVLALGLNWAGQKLGRFILEAPFDMSFLSSPRPRIAADIQRNAAYVEATVTKLIVVILQIFDESTIPTTIIKTGKRSLRLNDLSKFRKSQPL